MISPASRERERTPWELALQHLPIPNALKPFVVPPKIQRLYEQASSGAPEHFLPSLLRAMDVEPVMSDADMARIPREGPLVVVANHPFGLHEGLLLARLFDKVRPDVRILANSVLGFVPEMNHRLILVDPFGANESVRANGRGVRQVLTGLSKGGALLAFPAGEVSHFDFRQRAITDPRWNDKIVRFIRHTRSTALPMFISGANSFAFQLMGMVNARLRTAPLHELANKDHQRVVIRVGSPVSWSNLQTLGSDAETIRYLRYRTYLLAQRTPAVVTVKAWNDTRPLAAPAPTQEVEREVSALPAEQRLGESNEMEIYLTEPGQIAAGLAEIGRLREIAFRAEGEGTGHERDLDAFDSYYQHLFIWSRQERQILSISKVTADRDWTVAKAWLYQQCTGAAES